MGQEPQSRKQLFVQGVSALRRGMAALMDRSLQRILTGPLRPPGALEEMEFLSTCTRCNACVEACPFQAIHNQPASAGLAAGAPTIEPERQPCLWCEDFPCIAACQPAALRLAPLPAMGKAFVGEAHCLTWQDQVCTRCLDVCPFPEQALSLDDSFHPQVLDACVGCGQCTHACPTAPRSIQSLSPSQWRQQELKERLF